VIEKNNKNSESGMSYFTRRKISQKYCSKFGQVAIDKGYICAEQLHTVQEVQRQQEKQGTSHRLLGTILFDLDCMNGDPIESVLNTMQKMAREDQSTPTLKNDFDLTASRPISQEQACYTSGIRGNLSPAPDRTRPLGVFLA
jgi:hypothetical protein